MIPALKTNAAAGCHGPVKIELFKGCRSTVNTELLDGVKYGGRLVLPGLISSHEDLSRITNVSD